MAHFSIVVRGASFPRRNSNFDVSREWRSVRCQAIPRGYLKESGPVLLSKSPVKMFNNRPHVSGRLVDMLDHLESRIELLREHATAMEQERECLLSLLQTIVTNKDLHQISEYEREEIEVTANRLLTRTLTVEVSVATPRNDLQEKALNEVEEFINVLVQKIQTDMENAREICKLYLNTCLSDAKGPIDQRFQAVIIECTADDQKKTRKRLESLLSTIIHAEGTIPK